MMRRRPVRFFLVVFLLLTLAFATPAALRLDWPWAIAWVLGANLACFLIWGWDKLQARRGGWRVPENALHAIAALGAVPAAWLGMKVFRHKTLKPRFRVLYAVFLVIQVALVATLAGRS